MANILETVATYNRANLAFLDNEFCFLNLANKKFNNFNKITGNLGDTVTFDKPPRFAAESTLSVSTFGDVEQRKQTLTVDKAATVSYAITDQQRIFNVEKPGADDIGQYMSVFGEGAMKEIGTEVESDMASLSVTNTYRFFGDGVTAINSFGQLARAINFFESFGSAKHDLRGILPLLPTSDIVNSGLGQFALNRNNEMAMTWELGEFSGCEWYRSNLLPIHTAGNVGENATTLTFVSINAAGDQITFSGAATSDADAIKANDKLQFDDGVSGQPNLRYLTFIGHKVSVNPVQFRATADAASDGSGNVTINIEPALVGPTAAVTLGKRNQNLNVDLAAGMQAKALPSHRAGLLYSGDALYAAMPALPDTDPFMNSIETDQVSGVSMRMYEGFIFPEAQKGWVHQLIWGKTLVPEYALEMVFPLSQAG